MKLLIVNKFGKGKVKESDSIPRLGDTVDMFYEPLPKVVQVVLWPSKERLEHYDIANVQAVIIVD